MYETTGKVLFDRLFAAIALLTLSPLFVTVAVLIKLESRGGIFFLQERVGRQQALFTLYKFRTMSVDKERVLGQTGASSAGVER